MLTGYHGKQVRGKEIRMHTVYIPIVYIANKTYTESVAD